MVKISRVIRKHSEQMHAQQQQQQQTMRHHQKSVNIMYYIIGTFTVCYLPSYVFYIVDYGLRAAGIDTSRIEYHYAGHLANTLVLLNSALNPIIYCWRIEEIRQALVKLFRRLSQEYIN